MVPNQCAEGRDSGISKKFPGFFGKLLRHYRERGIPDVEGYVSRRELAALTLSRPAESTIEALELGNRLPSAPLTYHLSRALRLNDEEQSALLQAALADLNARYGVEYWEVANDR